MSNKERQLDANRRCLPSPWHWPNLLCAVVSSTLAVNQASTHHFLLVVWRKGGQGGHLEHLGGLGVLDEHGVHEEVDPARRFAALDPVWRLSSRVQHAIKSQEAR